MAAASRFCAFWIKNTIRKVTMVVPVLMTSCHVSEKSKNGPLTAHTMMVATARANTHARPTSREVALAIREKSRLRGWLPFGPSLAFDTAGLAPFLLAVPFAMGFHPT